eukprot:GEMP01022995.1.p1 GENE.GEMP01022995.1~~GEMP01022995.1.p1  ORF type:complete len:322 (+),score=53.95 GEMP01022995.1:198-1163(+)
MNFVRCRAIQRRLFSVLSIDGIPFPVDGPPEETILSLAERHNYSIPFDCRKGKCGICRVQATVGEDKYDLLACKEAAVAGLVIETLAPDTLALLKAPTELADQCIEALEHMAMSLPGDNIALQYDVDGSVKRKVTSLSTKLPLRKWKQLFDRNPHVHLDKAGLNDFDILVIGRLARFHTGQEIKMINLNNNKCGDSGCEATAEHFLRHLSLRSFFLSANGVTDKGVASLAEQLRTNRTVQILELRKNKITDEGAMILVAALEKQDTLNSLFLSDNQITDTGALALAKLAAQKNLKVWMMGNNVSAAMQASISSNVGKLVKW